MLIRQVEPKSMFHDSPNALRNGDRYFAVVRILVKVDGDWVDDR